VGLLLENVFMSHPKKGPPFPDTRARMAMEFFVVEVRRRIWLEKLDLAQRGEFIYLFQSL
jgi:hypothetical protein